ncbi:hypothetical protein [Streptomyces sp. NBC_01423]|uniref:hypothetical protein n=1 Tax=Streptomyces sp. NBC_01423 TaxID=2903860 RepID=UPI002E2A0585|nr:hypothetical protein [Streptomyces sp. NBC_01423]
MTRRNHNTACVCGSYSFEVLMHDDPSGDKVWQLKATGCAATTQSKFAPGHDAKLKSLIIQAGVGGHPVRRVVRDTVVSKDALRVAADLGWEGLVRDAIARGSS